MPQGDQSITYSFEIYKKGHKLGVRDLLCGGTPLTQRYLADEPNAVIKGSEMELSIINLNNTTPLSTFYADEDNYFRLDVYATYFKQSGDLNKTTYKIFTGYLVQDDCTEELTDFGHEVKLVFSDNLGLLKGINFSDANKISPTSAANLRQDIMVVGIIQPTPGNFDTTYVYVSKTTGTPLAGDYVTVQRAGERDGTYEIIKVTPHPTLPGYKLFIRETPPGAPLSAASALVSYVTASDLTWRIKLSDIVRICLTATNLPLNINYSGSLQPVDGGTTYTRFLENVQVDARTFLKDGTWDTCYTVLEKIANAFGLVFMQAEGAWHIMRVHELRYYNNAIGYYNYDQFMNYVGYYSPLTKVFNLAAGQIETGASETLIRPLQYYLEKFTYTQIPNTIYNGELSQLGVYVRRRSFTTDGVAYYDDQYEAPGYTLEAGLTNTYEILIHVIRRQDTLEEVDRFLRIQQTTGTPTVIRKVIRTKKIEINQGVRLKIKYQQVPWNANAANIYTFFQVEKGTNAADKYFVNGVKNDDGAYGWADLPSLNFAVSAQRPPYRPSSSLSTAFYPEDFIVPSQVSEITIETEPAPFSGVFYIYLGINSVETSKPALQDYRNISIEIVSPVNQSTKIGQQHKAYISKSLSNNKSLDIYCDYVFRNYIQGSLLLNSTTNLIQRGASSWKDGQTSDINDLPEIVTKQEELWRNKIRSKVELSFFPVVKNYNRIKPYDVINFALLPGKNFIFGRLEYDFKDNKVKGTMFEMWRTGEATAVGIAQDPEVKYEFKYLYK